MKVVLDKISKRFSNWLFKDLDYEFNSGVSYAVTGANGAGKSTLLKVIAGMIPSNTGAVKHYVDNTIIDPDKLYRYLSYVAPYLEIPEELTLREFLRFHFSLKPRVQELSISQMVSKAGLKHAIDKPLHTYSSGMKQRCKLIQGLYCDTPLLFLDEPTTNLDNHGFTWYHEEISKMKSEKLIIIGSNQPNEYDFCDQIISL